METAQLITPQKSGNLFANLLQRKFFPSLAFGICALLLIGFGIWWMRKPTQQIAVHKNNPVSPAQNATLLPSPSNTPPNLPAVPPAEKASTPPILSSQNKNERGVATAPRLAMILLSPQLTRGDSQAPKLQLQAGTEQIQIELELADVPAKSYQVQLQTPAGKIIKRWERVATINNSSLPTVRFRLSATSLTTGAYDVLLLDPRAQTRQIYSLQIVRE